MPQNAVPDETGGELTMLQPASNADSSDSSGIIANGNADTEQQVANMLISNTSNNAPNANGRTNGRSQPHSSTALQDMFLNGLRRENIDVVVYFSDGTQERGVVRAFDTFTLLLENRGSGKAQLIYKHAIARIFPVRTPSMALGSAGKKKDA